MSIRKLSKKLQKIAENELTEVPNRIPEDLDNIREWLKKNPYLISRTDDQWLISFLRGCKYSLERTKEKLDTFYTSRISYKDFYENRDPFLPEIQEILQAGVMQALPRPLGDTGPRIFLIDYSRANTETMSIVNLAKVYLMISDILMVEDDNFIVSGVIVWKEFTNFPLGYILQMTPFFLNKILSSVINCYPARLKGIRMTNAPPLFETIYNLIKSMVPEKIKNRMSLHSSDNMESFYKVVPQEYLTKAFNGKNGSHQELTAYWKKKVESYRDWFLEDKKYGTNESLRPAPQETESFGIDGSFRKLGID